MKDTSKDSDDNNEKHSYHEEKTKKRPRCEQYDDKREQNLQGKVLLDDARSFGPYLWTSRDLRNALLWFDEDVSKGENNDSLSNSRKEHVVSHSSTEHEKKHFGRKDLLRILLFSRGVYEFCRRRSWSRKDDDDPSTMSQDLFSSDEQVSDTIRKLKRNRLKQKKRQEPLLKYVLENYWNLSSTISQYDNLSITNKNHNSKKDFPYVPLLDMKSSHGLQILQEDLAKICTIRFVSQKLQNLCKETTETTTWIENKSIEASLSILNSEHSHHYKKLSSKSSLHVYTMSVIASNKYFSSPETIMKRAYAVQLFDRLLEMMDTKKNNIKETETESTKDVLPTCTTVDKMEIIIQFLQKLRKLSIQDTRIREVHLLMLLEPARRNNRELSKKRSPLDLSTISSILNDSVLTFAQQLDHDSESMKRKKISTSCINYCLWCLPSPLLCSVSQAYESIGKEYIDYLIHATMNSSDHTPKALAAALVEVVSDRKNTNFRASSDDESNITITRLLRLGATSDSLLSLIFDRLQSLEFKTSMAARTKSESQCNDEDRFDDAQHKRIEKDLKTIHLIMNTIEENFSGFDFAKNVQNFD